MADVSAPLSKTIKITDSDFERLKGYGEPFESPGRALARALDRSDDANAMAEHLSGIVDMITDDGITFVANFNTEFRGRIKDAREYLIARGAPRER